MVKADPDEDKAQDKIPEANTKILEHTYETVTKNWAKGNDLLAGILAKLRSRTTATIPAVQVESPPDSSNLNTVTGGAEYDNIKAQAEIPDADIMTVTENSDNNIRVGHSHPEMPWNSHEDKECVDLYYEHSTAPTQAMGGAETKGQMFGPNWDKVEDFSNLKPSKQVAQFDSAYLGKLGEENISKILTGNLTPAPGWCKDSYLPTSGNQSLPVLCPDLTFCTKTKTNGFLTDCCDLEDPADAESITQYCEEPLIHFLRCGDVFSHFRNCESVLADARNSLGAKDPPKLTIPEVGRTSSCFQDIFSVAVAIKVSYLFNLALQMTELYTEVDNDMGKLKVFTHRKKKSGYCVRLCVWDPGIAKPRLRQF